MRRTSPTKSSRIRVTSHGAAFIGLRVLMFQPQCDQRELCLRLFQTRVWFEARDRQKTEAGARQRPVNRIGRPPDFRIVREMESWRQDADNG